MCCRWRHLGFSGSGRGRRTRERVGLLRGDEFYRLGVILSGRNVFHGMANRIDGGNILGAKIEVGVNLGTKKFRGPSKEQINFSSVK